MSDVWSNSFSSSTSFRRVLLSYQFLPILQIILCQWNWFWFIVQDLSFTMLLLSRCKSASKFEGYSTPCYFSPPILMTTPRLSECMGTDSDRRPDMRGWWLAVKRLKTGGALGEDKVHDFKVMERWGVREQLFFPRKKVDSWANSYTEQKHLF